MRAVIFNKAHYVIKIAGWTFKPFEEQIIYIGSYDYDFKLVRSNKNLRIDEYNNESYKKRHNLKIGTNYNFIYDEINQHAGNAYKYAIEALANPIIENLPKNETGYFSRPVPGIDYKGINIRFFSSMRINQQGKCSIGPNDIFISHGIGDKNYWTGKHIRYFNYAFCTGPTWENRMRDTGYKGEIFQVGYTKLDPIFQGKYTKRQSKNPVIAWLPTHGYGNKHKGRSSYPFFEKFLNQFPAEYEIINGMHPTTKMNSKKKQTPTIQKLIDADIVIADAGSTLYESWAIGTPVIFPDWICKHDIMKHFENDTQNLEYQIYSKKIGYHAKDFKEMLILIEKALIDGMKDEEKDFIENIFPEKFRGQSGKIAAETLKDIRGNLL